MFKKYLKLFDESEYSTKLYDSFNDSEWNWFLKTYEYIFRTIDKSIFQWYFNLGNFFTILSAKNNDNFGIYGLLNIKVSINGKTSNSYLCHNVGIKKEYSGKGFFQLIGEKALDTVLNNNEIALGFPNKASKKGHIRLGWEEIGSMQFIAYSSNDERQLPLNNKYIFEEVSSIPVNIKELVDSTSHMFSLRLQKESKFLNWRSSKPLSHYKIYLIKKSQKLVGYLVLKEYLENNEKRLHLVDFLFENTDVLNSLIIFSIKQYKSNNYDVFNTWIVADSFYKDIFSEHKFTLQDDMPIYPIIVFQKEKRFDFAKINKRKMFFTLFDNDVF